MLVRYAYACSLRLVAQTDITALHFCQRERKAAVDRRALAPSEYKTKRHLQLRQVGQTSCSLMLLLSALPEPSWAYNRCSVHACVLGKPHTPSVPSGVYTNIYFNTLQSNT